MLGDLIRKYRKEKGYSQAQLAIKLHITQGAISQWENNKTMPEGEQMQALADALGVSVGQLFGDAQAQVPQEDERMELLERIREDRDFRLLYAAAMKASPEHIRAATAMLNALKPEDFPE